jgi:hypothetical protein
MSLIKNITFRGQKRWDWKLQTKSEKGRGSIFAAVLQRKFYVIVACGLWPGHNGPHFTSGFGVFGRLSDLHITHTFLSINMSK